VEIILTHENADFDAIAALYAAHKLFPDAAAVMPSRVNQNVTRFMEDHQALFAECVSQDSFKAKQVQHITLVDTQRPQSLRKVKRTTPTRIIDHHPPKRILQSHETFEGEEVGAATTLLVERMQAQGMLQGPGYHALQALSRHAFADASAVVTLAPGMAERMRRYTTSATPVSWVPLWVPEGLEPWSSERPPALRAERGWEPERLVLLYSGNLGLGHRFDELLDVARTLGPSGPRWAFAGAGRARPQVEQFVRAHPELPVELLPNVPDARLREHLCSADVHVVSLAPSWEDTLLPSKLQAALAVHKPVLYLGDPRGDLGRWITDYGIGWVVPPGDTGALLAALARASDRVERADCVAAAGEAARSRFGRAPNIARMIELLTAS